MDAFLLHLALSFVLGGATVAAFTTIAERAGSRLGGLLLSFPVKVTISLVFIALTGGVAFASDAAVSAPAGMGSTWSSSAPRRSSCGASLPGRP